MGDEIEPMADAQVIWRLVQELIANGGSPEEVCRDYPELVDDVRRQWKCVRAVEEQLDALFPSSYPTRTHAGLSVFDRELPQPPGYEVQGILGHGGMGVVFRAQHLALNRAVAMKMVLAGAYASGPDRERLLREAQAVAALRHPNIVTVYDVGECDGKPFFTMELVEGQNLAERLAGTPQSARDSAAMLTTLADAVHSAHHAGIVHRDLKPANVLLTLSGTPKITDFGLARHFEGEAALTLTGLQVGTPSYMAPEQASGQTDAVGPGVDIYSLGALLYEMLTGRPPFRAETALETQRQVIEDEPAAPSRLNSKVPRDLETICLKCLQKTASRRYKTARDLADDLRRYLAGEPIAARRAGSLERMVKWVRRRPSRALVLAGSVLIVLSLAGATLWVGWQRAATASAVDEDLRHVSDSQRSSDWVGARAALERAKGRLGTAGAEHLRQRVRQAEDDLALVAALDSIQLNRAAFAGTGIDMADAQASLAYRAAFRQAGLWDGDGMPAEAAADRVLRSNVRDAILGALDEMEHVRPGVERLAVAGRAARGSGPVALARARPGGAGGPVPAYRTRRKRTARNSAREAPVSSQQTAASGRR